jgi:hypothetical protein
MTPRFNRVQPWYFYFEVLALGFLPVEPLAGASVHTRFGITE